MTYKLKSIVVFFRIISDLLIVRNFGRICIYILCIQRTMPLLTATCTMVTFSGFGCDYSFFLSYLSLFVSYIVLSNRYINR